jgi:hypothetical protein
VKRYTHIVLRRMPPLNGFSIKTPEGKFLSDIRPRGIVMELNRLNDHIKLLKSSGDELLEWLKDGTISDSNYRLLANAWQRAKENKR